MVLQANSGRVVSGAAVSAYAHPARASTGTNDLQLPNAVSSAGTDDGLPCRTVRWCHRALSPLKVGVLDTARKLALVAGLVGLARTLGGQDRIFPMAAEDFG